MALIGIGFVVVGIAMAAQGLIGPGIVLGLVGLAFVKVGGSK